MKAIERTIYMAHDGSEFETETLCRAHERKALVGLTEADIEAARTRTNAELADAIEAFGYELTKARRAAGILKRSSSRRERKQMDAAVAAC